MSNKYLEWIKNHWQNSAILVLVYIIVTLIPVFFRLELIEFMLLLAFPLYLVHEIEEYILPGGFDDFFNKNLLNINPSDAIVPIDKTAVFWINFIFIWLVIPFFSGLGFIHLSFSAWIPYFLIFQGLSHLAMGLKGKKIINPGIRSSFILHLPYAFIMISLYKSSGIIHHPIMNIHLVIGFIFNGLLPVIAVMPNKYGIMSRYRRRIEKEKFK